MSRPGAAVPRRGGAAPSVVGRLSGAAPDQLAARVEALLADGSRSAGREAVRHLSTAAEARRIIALYEEVLAPRPRRARVAAIMRSNRAP